MVKSRTKKRDLYIGRVSKKRRFMKAFFWLFFACLLCVFIVFGTLYYQVYSEADTRIDRGVIKNIIFSESPVFYDDGKTPIGVFFEKTHRRYVEYEDIPITFIKAIIAAEDHEFFTHSGFDPKAILRAFMANLKARKVVQGGSTITQQTAKNVFKREKRSYKAKLKEFFQALVLEQKYSKEEILELYSNQFFVSGFGRGLEIAAKYFFDKDAKELDLVECAFIAGSVKGPNRYNPFIKKTEVERIQAVKNAKNRKDYVLQKMLELNFMTKEQFKESKEREVPFREGRVTYRLNVILDYVREQLQSPYFQEVLTEQGIENIATSGIRIYTSINRQIQEGVLQSLRKRLPRLDVQLKGYSPAGQQQKYEDLKEALPKRNGAMPFLCTVSHVNTDKENPSIVVSWDGGGGLIDSNGMQDLCEAWIQSEKGVWGRFDPKFIPEFLKLFKEGDLVAVRILDESERTGGSRLVLTQIPELEGGVIVLQRGMIRAMVGGYFNRHFNRATDAKRQLGSTFKPIVYTAALQLKWNTLDTLMNTPELFLFENTSYIPSPDHMPQTKEVSMAWAGVKSENLATVWLLYHLTDHLNLSEFKEIMRQLGLHRFDDESYEGYVNRIRDKYGVVVNREALMEAAFTEAKKAIESDVIFSGYDGALQNLRSLLYKVDKDSVDLFDPEELRIYRLSFERLRNLDSEMQSEMDSIRDALKHNALSVPAGALKHFGYFRDRGGRLRIAYFKDFQKKDSMDALSITANEFVEHPGLLRSGGVWVDGLIPSEVLNLLHRHTIKTYKQLVARNHYDADILFKIRDFRVLVNLHYVRELARQIGISSHLDPVLSFPLGSNSISIAESARAYQSMMSGVIHTLSENYDEAIPLITRIEDREGEILWEYDGKVRRVLSQRTTGMVSEILRLVVEKGTGKRADKAIKIALNIEDSDVNLFIPAYGKTGTANRYTNSTFVGFLPGPDSGSGELELEPGYVIAVYVGYDDNRPMKGKNITIYGSSGALPVWIDTSNAIVSSREYRDKLQIADLAFDVKPGPMTSRSLLRPVHISSLTGLPMRLGNYEDNGKEALIFSDVDIDDGTVRLRRVFEPIKRTFKND
jgi:membrane peptidoglycan carboxypeptidase